MQINKETPGHAKHGLIGPQYGWNLQVLDSLEIPAKIKCILLLNVRNFLP